MNVSRRNGWAIGICLSLAAVVAASAEPMLLEGDGAFTDHERLVPGQYPAAPGTLNLSPPLEPLEPLAQIDWSVGLRGSYVTRPEVSSFEAALVPQVSLLHEGVRTTTAASGSAEISLPVENQLALNGLDLSLTGLYRLDSVTVLTGTASLDYDRPNPADPGIASSVAQPADSLAGVVRGSATREFGRVSASLSGSAARTVYGETLNVDGTSIDNASSNLWALGGGLRVSYALTPILSVFADGSVERDIFDAGDANGLKADAIGTAFSAGVLGQWNGILAAEASIGAGQRRFDAAELGEINSTLFSARLTFTPDPTVAITASAAQTIEPVGANSQGIARIATNAQLDAAYTVNSWLTLRGNASWYTARFVGSPATESGHGAGLGADYAVNAHTQLSADYGFSHTNSTAQGSDDAHRVTVGITLAR